MDLGITKQQKTMVAVLLSGTLLVVLNMTLLTPALPAIMADTGVTATTAQWLTSGYALVEAVMIPLSAYMMGRFSLRRLFAACMAVFAMGSCIAACALGFWPILAGRMVQAACTGILMPVVTSVVLMTFPKERRGTAMGIVGLVIGFAPMLGPTVSGLLVDHVSWRAIFVLVTAFALAVVALSAKLLENLQSFERAPFDATSVALSTIGLLCVLYGLSTLTTAEQALFPIALIAAGALVVGLYVRRQLKLEQPMLYMGVLRSPRFRTALAVVLLFNAGLIGLETIMPLYIQSGLGNSATVSGLVLLPGALLGGLADLLSGRLFDRCGVRRPVLIGAGFLVIAVAGFLTLDAESSVLMVCASYTLGAVGMQFTMTPLNTWGINSLPNDDIRYAQGIQNTLNQVAGSFGIALLVSVSAAGHLVRPDLTGAALECYGYHMSFIGVAVLVLAAVAVIVAVVRENKVEAL